MEWRNEEFDLGGVNHLALVCTDMKRTVEFYTDVLGMRLIKTIDLPGRHGSALLLRHRRRRRAGVLLVPRRPRPGPRRLGAGDRARHG